MRVLAVTLVLLALNPGCARSDIFRDSTAPGDSELPAGDAEDDAGPLGDSDLTGDESGDPLVAGDSDDGDPIQAGGDGGGDDDPMPTGSVGATACEPDLCWVLPGPAGGGILDLHVSATGDLWAAAGTAYALRREGNAWVPHALPEGQQLSVFWDAGGSLFGMGKAGIWARWTGSEWEEMSPSAPGQAIESACATDDGTVWAGDFVALYELTEAGWTTDNSVAVNDLFCLPEEAWRLTDDGVDHYNSNTWDPVFSVGQGSKIQGYGHDNLWVAAVDVQYWNGITADVQNTSRMVNDISLLGNERWVVGGFGYTARWNGSTWEEVASETSRELNAVAMVAENDVWFGGEAGVLLHWNGSTLSTVEDQADHNYQNGWSNTVNDIWLVGAKGDGSGLTYHWDGSAWTDVANPSTVGLHQIWGFATDDVWAGADDTLVHWNGTDWSTVDIGQPAEVYALWGPSPDDLWILQRNAVIRWNGSVVTTTPALPTSTSGYAAIWGATNTDVCVGQHQRNVHGPLRWRHLGANLFDARQTGHPRFLGLRLG